MQLLLAGLAIVLGQYWLPTDMWTVPGSTMLSAQTSNGSNSMCRVGHLGGGHPFHDFGVVRLGHGLGLGTLLSGPLVGTLGWRRHETS